MPCSAVRSAGGRASLVCPHCRGERSEVLEARNGAVFRESATWRRRKCKKCGGRWSTIEFAVAYARKLLDGVLDENDEYTLDDWKEDLADMVQAVHERGFDMQEAEAALKEATKLRPIWAGGDKS